MARLRDLLLQAVASLWFIPALLTLVQVAMAFGAIAIDVAIDQRGDAEAGLAKAYPYLFGVGESGARAMLSTVAGALVTAAGVILSGVLVALSIASGQYTSRILRSFTGNRMHQSALGVILGSFGYALIVLRSIGVGPGEDFVPELAVLGAVPLTFLSVLALLLFAHAVARSIQASEILVRIAEDTKASARARFDADRGDGESPEDPEVVPLDGAGTEAWTSVAATASGYLRAVDEEALADLAAKVDAIIRVEHQVGDFIAEGSPALSISCPSEPLGEELEGALCAHLHIGSFRTVEQDPAFGIRQLVDIALRALSPGVNDVTTADMAAHRIMDVLMIPATAPAEGNAVRRDGELRLIVRRRDFGGLLELAHEQLLRAAADAPRVLATLAEGWVALDRAAARASHSAPRRKELADFVAPHRDWIEEASRAEPVMEDARRTRAALDTLLGGKAG